MMKKLLVLLMVLGMVVMFSNVGSAAPAAPVKIIKLGHIAPPEDPFNVLATKFAELVAAKTSGQVKVEVFPGGQLGNDREQIEAMRMGSQDMSIEGSINYEAFVPETAFVDLPFMFKDRQTAFKALDGPTSQQIWGTVIEKIGVRILVLPENGFRQITTAKTPIKSLADLKGLKMRVPQTKLYMDTFKALGTLPTPITFTELFTALQSGVVEGEENGMPLIYSSKFYEVQKFLAVTNHIYDAAPLAMSEKTWKSLTPDQQKAVQAAAIEARDFQRKYVIAREDDLIKKLQAAGMTFTYPARDEFLKAVQPVIDGYKAKFGDAKFNKVLAGQ
ncbi:MAG: TRAP transporter substrate-binding protein [Deltaproteobacteria bacterium]|nr:TRAP transporter substrate-binding protein [Deltaproteobacteria bacterium]